jgi:ATP-binding protein involved in chromosome partitioning
LYSYHLQLMGISEDQLLQALKLIIHPSSGKDIISMDLVKNINLTGKGVSFDLMFTSMNDPLKTSIKKACEITLREKFGADFQPEINIVSPLKPVIPEAQKPILAGVKNIIAVASGKGGVGKSTVAVNLALEFAKAGARVGLIDADIFGPSIPKMLGLENVSPAVKQVQGKDVLVPVEKYGVKVLSIGFFVAPEDATVWRGPMATNALKQLINDADWGELDYLFFDLPPGTSDIHLTLVQTVSVTGAIIVSTPQSVALADAIKGINMFRNDNIAVPILGLIENMAWFTPEELPDNKYYIFGKEGCVDLAHRLGIPMLGQIPLVQSIREGSDEGLPAILTKNKDSEPYKLIAEKLRIEIIKRNTTREPTQKVEITRRRYSDFKK